MAAASSVYVDDASLPYVSTSLSQPVRIRVGESGIAARTPVTVIQQLQATAKKFGNSLALTAADGKTWTWSQYYAEVKATAASFIKLGLEKHQAVNIIGFNSVEWFLADVGAIAAGGVAAGIYTTNEPEACFYVANHSDAIAVVCEGRAQLAKFLRVQDRLPHLKALIVYNAGDVKTDLSGRVKIYTWEDFMKLGADVPAEEVEKRMTDQSAGDVCTLIYTSGTTGPPKAVMCSNDNITFTAAAVVNLYDMLESDVMVSYLPLSHIAAQMLDIHSAMLVGFSIFFADAGALKGSIVDTLKKANPTIFFAVPRVWEKIQEKMVAVGRSNTGLKAHISAWAKAKGRQQAEALQYGSTTSHPSCYGCANKIVFSKVREALGLGRTRIAASGASPISKDTINYFAQLDLHIFELFGMSESTGPAAVNTPDHWKIGTVGIKVPGTTLELVDGTSEIVFKGRHVFMGYLKMEDQTKSTIDDKGFLHSGDKGAIDADGFLRITGRIKELIKTSGGENVAPVLIEDSLKKHMPFLSNVVVIGDNKKFLACLVTLKVKVNPDSGEASDELTADALHTSQVIGSSATTVEQAINDPKWHEVITKGIAKSNKEDAISRAQYIQKFKILPHDFTLPGGELTPTLKLKRNVVYQKHAKEIEAVYAEAEATKEEK